MRVDFVVMVWLVLYFVGWIPVAALVNLLVLVELFVEIIIEELDFCFEVVNMFDVVMVLVELG